ncbi:MAG: DUF4332 domain-containing protein [Anaerolineales bacterium]|nr:MAG: DUF4332 domain-containing protein [Anaerolineales bacterium]
MRLLTNMTTGSLVILKFVRGWNWVVKPKVKFTKSGYPLKTKSERKSNLIDKKEFVDWIKKQHYVGKGFREDEEELTTRLYGSLDRFYVYLQEQHGIAHIEDTTLDILRQYDFNYPENDDQNLRLAFDYLGKQELAAYMVMVSADKYFRNKKLAVMLNAMDALQIYVKDLRKANIRMASELLEQGATPGGRTELAVKTGVPEEQILKLVQCCDLCRMTGMAGQTLRRAFAMGYDTLEKFRATPPECIEVEYVNFLQETGEKSNKMVDFPSFVHQSQKLGDVIVY